MRDHEALTVIERGKAEGMTPLQAIREHLGMTREAVAKIVKFDPECLAVCEDHAGVAMPDLRFRLALAGDVGVGIGISTPAAPATSCEDKHDG